MLKSLCSAAFSLTVLLACAGMGLMAQGVMTISKENEPYAMFIGVASLILGSVIMAASVITWLFYRYGGPWKEDEGVVDPPAPKPPIHTASIQAPNCPPAWDETMKPCPPKPLLVQQLTFDDKLICSDKDQKEKPKESTLTYPPIKLKPGNKSGTRKQRFIDKKEFIELWNDQRSTIYDIAWYYNVSTTSICNWAFSWGLPPHSRKPKASLKMEDLIKALNHKGMKEYNRDALWLCSTLDVSDKTLRKRIQELNEDQELLAKVYGEGR